MSNGYRSDLRLFFLNCNNITATISTTLAQLKAFDWITLESLKNYVLRLNLISSHSLNSHCITSPLNHGKNIRRNLHSIQLMNMLSGTRTDDQLQSCL